MFTDPDFIEASRDWVMVRIETYESEQSEQFVRNFLGGRFENTVFCLLAPDGEERLTKASRGPEQVLGRGNSLAEMQRIVKSYRPRERDEAPLMQDFDTFKQALNVASSDQRLLVVVAGDESEVAEARESMREVAWSDEHVGRFHFDFSPEEGWNKAVSKRGADSGIFIIRPGEFGMEGVVVDGLSLDASPADLSSVLAKANEKFAADEERKVYSEHVAEGRREGVKWESVIEYGEDRDGDGEIDNRGRSDGPSGR